MKRITDRTVFLTGTDTEVGKTFVACGLLAAARKQGLDVCGFKPVAAGARKCKSGLRNPDALALMRASGTTADYDTVNPYVFAPGIAPHLAAGEADTRISLPKLNAAHRRLEKQHDWVLVEGAGGWQVPLNRRTTLADWVASQGWPVVLVVGMKLGCINHALLSAASILRSNPLIGWIANALPPEQARLDENILTLKRMMPAPLLGTVAKDSRDFDSMIRRITAACESPRES